MGDEQDEPLDEESAQTERRIVFKLYLLRFVIACIAIALAYKIFELNMLNRH
jgi:hypothetical protein